MPWYHNLRTQLPPLLAVLGGSALGLSSSMKTEVKAEIPAREAPSTPLPSAVTAAVVEDVRPFAASEESDEQESDGATVEGEVLEQIDVGKYSYLRLGAAGTETWAAVPKTRARRGERVLVDNAQLMTDFTSPTLRRTFEAIYFGELGEPVHQGDEAQACPAAPGHEGAEDAPPHPGAGRKADSVPVSAVAPAPGPNGRVVLQVHRTVQELAGKRIRVRGVVVKSTPGVMGRTFVHLRDGSGEAADGSNDLTVTTTAEPAVGTEVVFEGTVEQNRDFGSGYRYDVVLSEATVAKL